MIRIRIWYMFGMWHIWYTYICVCLVHDICTGSSRTSCRAFARYRREPPVKASDIPQKDIVQKDIDNTKDSIQKAFKIKALKILNTKTEPVETETFQTTIADGEIGNNLTYEM